VPRRTHNRVQNGATAHNTEAPKISSDQEKHPARRHDAFSFEELPKLTLTISLE